MSSGAIPVCPRRLPGTAEAERGVGRRYCPSRSGAVVGPCGTMPPMRRVRPFATPEQRVGTGLWLGAGMTFGALDTMAPWLLLPAAFAFALAAAGWVQLHRRGVREDRRDTGKCVDCGYDLRGNASGVCPECGEAIR